MKAGDEVVVNAWVFAVSTPQIHSTAEFIKSGTTGKILHFPKPDIAVVQFESGRAAPINISLIQPRRLLKCRMITVS